MRFPPVARVGRSGVLSASTANSPKGLERKEEDDLSRAVFKTITGIYIAQTFFNFLIFPSLPAGPKANLFAKCAFWALYAPLFFVTFPASVELAGRQTLTGNFAENGKEICTRNF